MCVLLLTQASCQLLNGANVLVCTPPSLLRLYANNTEAFSQIRYLVSYKNNFIVLEIYMYNYILTT